jgi:hypothetical protein
LTGAWQIAGRVIASLVQWTGRWSDWGARKGKTVVAREMAYKGPTIFKMSVDQEDWLCRRAEAWSHAPVARQSHQENNVYVSGRFPVMRPNHKFIITNNVSISGRFPVMRPNHKFIITNNVSISGRFPVIRLSTM